MSDAVVVCSNLSFSWPDTPVFSDLSFTVTTGRTGPVTPTGTGRSTLLKLIAGELQSATGSSCCHRPQPVLGVLRSGTSRDNSWKPTL